MKYCALLIALILIFTAQEFIAQAQSPPPYRIRTPHFAQQSAQYYDDITIVNTTSSGAVWILERRFTYGDAAIVTALFAVVLLLVFDIMLRLATLRV